MSLQWKLAAVSLYMEMAFLFLMCLPFISSARLVGLYINIVNRTTYVNTFVHLPPAQRCMQSKNCLFDFRWNRIFNSHLLSRFLAYSHLYFNVFVVVMLVLFIGKLYIIIFLILYNSNF